MKRIGENIVLFEEHGQLVARITDPVMCKQALLLPGEKVQDTNGHVLMQMPWNEEACRILGNLGVDAAEAAPLVHNNKVLVEGKYQPMKHQLVTAAFITMNPRCYVLSDPRTGKTGSLVLAMDYLQKNRFVTGGFLIITTVTTMPGVWRDSIQAALPRARVVLVNGKNREKALAQPADFYVTNYDSVRLSRGAFCQAVDDGRIGACVIDELTHVGNISSQRHKAIDMLVNATGRNGVQPLEFCIGVTGSPGENPQSVFGMCRVVNKYKLPCRTQTAWLNMTTYQYGPEPFMRKLSARAPDIIHKAMQPAIRYNKADIIDLPPVTTQNRECDLSKAQAEARDEFRTKAVALMESGETITAANGGVLYQKLMQVAQGFVMDNEGNPHALDHKERTKVIIEAIEESSNKVVIFCCFKATVRMLAKELTDAGYTVGIVDGSVTGQQRADTLAAFQSKKDPHVLIAHPTTTAYGVELAAADTLIFNGPPPLGGFIYAQALERLSSAKQKASNINIIRVMASPEEKKFFRTLDAGRDLGNFISTLFEDYTKGNLL